MIKLLTGLSAPVGSTVGLTTLCNQLNDRGHECILFGPDYWHLDKCRSGKIGGFRPEKGDTIIVQNIKLLSLSVLHNLKEYLSPPKKSTLLQTINNTILHILPAGKNNSFQLILRYGENDLFSLRQIKSSLFDKVHFISNNQNCRHYIPLSSFICPDFIEELKESNQKPDRVAGVIGSIRKENKIECAITNALKEGMKKIILYGYLHDPIYYYTTIEPLVKTHPGKIQFASFMDNKQKMYDSVSDVYLAANKPWSSIKRECGLTKTCYHGPKNSQENQWMTNDQIYDVWKAALGL